MDITGSSLGSIMVETYGSWKVISQSSIPTGIDLNVKIRYNGNSSLSVEFIDMAAGAKRAEKPENTAFVSLVKWI